jgi:hypothetical protein
MIDASKTGTASVLLPDDPPNLVVMQARNQARALKRCVYVYGNQSNWVTTTDLHEPPSDAAVWMISAH